MTAFKRMAIDIGIALNIFAVVLFSGLVCCERNKKIIGKHEEIPAELKHVTFAIKLKRLSSFSFCLILE